jgi:pilus assembly protein CpaE
LVVDDVKDTRRHIRELLSSQPDMAVVGEASDGDEAIERYAALLPDVMTTCINMPRMDGISATEVICSKHPGANVVIVSVQSSSNYVRRALMAGACDYLTKPPLRAELLSAIRRAAGRATFAPENIAPK